MKTTAISILSLALIGVLPSCTTTSYLSGNKSNKYSNSFTVSPETASALGLGSVELSAETAIAASRATGDSGVVATTLISLLAASDRACEDYMSGMITASNSVTSGLSIAGLALSSAASLTSPTRSANLLSGISTFAGGTEKQLSDTVLGGKSPPLLYRAVMAVRKKERSKIATLIERGAFSMAAVEMEPYHAKCGPTVGINALDESVENSSQTATESGQQDANAAIALLN